MKRARYNKEFKINSVKYALSSGQSVKNVSVELGVSSGTLHRWMNEYDEYGESAFPGHGSALFNYFAGHTGGRQREKWRGQSLLFVTTS